MGILAGFLSMFGWGISDFLAAKSSRKIGYILTSFWTQIVFLFIPLIYFLVKFSTFNINIIPQFLFFLLPAGFLFLIGSLAFYKGFEEGQVSLVSPMAGSWVIITVILSLIFLKEILEINQIMAIILIIIGIILISINAKKLFKIKKLNIFRGIKEGLVAMFGWGLALFLIIPPSRVLGWFLPVFLMRSFEILFLASYMIFDRQSFKINFQPPILTLILVTGLLDMVAFFAYSFGVKGDYVSLIAPVAASFPLVAVILAKIFLKEQFLLNQVFGIVSIITGLILISI